jgi:hypothetical protein
MEKKQYFPFKDRFPFMRITGIILFFLLFFLPSLLYGHNGFNNYTPSLHIAAVPQSPCQVNLYWTDCYADEKGYQIFRKTGIIDRFTIVHTAEADETSWIDTSVTPGTLYLYFIKPLVPHRQWIFPHVYLLTPGQPVEVPASPGHLSALAVAPGQVQLAWPDLSDNEYGFKIERKVPGGEFTIITEVPANSTRSMDNDNTLLPGTDYIYRVISFNPLGDSLPTNEARVTIPLDAVETPASPCNLTCVPLSFNQVLVTWTDTAYNEESFIIERKKKNEDEFTVVMEAPAGIGKYFDTGLEKRTTYSYRIRAGNSKGFSAYTPVVDVTTMSNNRNKPEVPSHLIAIVKSAVRVDLSWIDNADNEFGYIIQRREKMIWKGWGFHNNSRDFQFQNIGIVQSSNTWSDITVQPGTCYEYRIFAFNEKNKSRLSNSTSVRIPGIPATVPKTPSGLTGNPVSAHQIDLSWNDTAQNEYGFLIQRKTGGGEFAIIDIVPPDVLQWSDKNVYCSDSYTYRITAFNAAGQSQPSNEVTVYTPCPPENLPAAPSHLEVLPLSATQMKLIWIDNSCNEYGFGIQRRSVNGEYLLVSVIPPNNSGSSVEIIDTGLLPDTGYFYRIYAYNGKGISACSNEAHNATLRNPHHPPMPPEITSAESLSPTKISITWKCYADNEEGFIIQRKKEKQDWNTVHIAGVDAHTWIDTGVAPDTSYMYRIAAYNLCGQSFWSREYPVTPSDVSRLVFTVQPSETISGDIMSPAIELEIQNKAGNRIQNADDYVTIALGGNPAGGTLSGTTTVQAVNGRIIFDDLSIEKFGEGYTLIASLEGFAEQESEPFIILPLYLTVQNNGNGSTNPAGTIPVSYQDTIPVSAQAQYGYHFAEWAVENGAVTILDPDTAETTAVINHGDAQIQAVFDINTYTITATCGPAGTITPEGEIIVEYGGSQEFIIAAAENYCIQDIKINGESILLENTSRNNDLKIFSYTFYNVNSPHTIEASFTKGIFYINAISGENGTISPAGDVPVPCGDSASFTITPDDHFHIEDVLVDGASVGAVSEYSFTGVAADHTIQVEFTRNEYIITATSEGPGTLTPSGEQPVTDGDTLSFTMTPDTHCHIEDVIIDGSSIGAVSTYEFQQITSDHTIHVRFAIDTVVITATADPNGTISPAGEVTVDWGGTITFTITPSSGYEILQVEVDGELVGPVTSYTFENVTTPHTIYARFPEHLEWEWGTWNYVHHPTSEVSVTTYDGRATVLKFYKYANYHAKLYKHFTVQNNFIVDLSYFPVAVYSSDWGPIMKIQWDNGGIAWIQDRESGFARWGMTGQTSVERNSILRNGKQYTLRISVTDTQVSLMYKEIGDGNEWLSLMTGARDSSMSGNITIILGTQSISDDTSGGNQETYYYDNLSITE